MAGVFPGSCPITYGKRGSSLNWKVRGELPSFGKFQKYTFVLTVYLRDVRAPIGNFTTVALLGRDGALDKGKHWIAGVRLEVDHECLGFREFIKFHELDEEKLAGPVEKPVSLFIVRRYDPGTYQWRCYWIRLPQ